MKFVWKTQTVIALFAAAAIALHLILWFSPARGVRLLHIDAPAWPLLAALVFGGGPLVLGLVRKALRREFGSDLLAGLSIVTSLLLGEYLAGVIVVLMLSGGETLEDYAVRNASSSLEALARRMPTRAHRRQGAGLIDVAMDDVAVGDLLVVLPHEICPADGRVVTGHGTMDESYLTGEPYAMSKTPGTPVYSGAINGPSAITIRADKQPIDSRHAQIMRVMQESERRRPALQRLGDQLGAWYTPAAIAIAVAAWIASGNPVRFLAVLVIATPCPLLIAIPVAIIGSISLAARRGIVVKDPAALEQLSTCTVIIFDKTGTLTYGKPALVESISAPGVDRAFLLGLAAAVERYSKHPLAGAVLEAASAAGLPLREASEVHEEPGRGLTGVVDGHRVRLTNRVQLVAEIPGVAEELPPPADGIECLVAIDGEFASVLRFRDEPRADGAPFVRHLGGRHAFDRVLLISGDRESEVRYLADKLGITEVYFGQSPEQKLALVGEETRHARTIFVGDGLNDAPALTAATVGVAFGQANDITAEAAEIVLLDSSLVKVDEMLHIGRRMRRVALESAVGGMALSLVGMLVAAAGGLAPVSGAIGQEIIDILAVVNALRAAWPATLTDY